MIWFFKEFFRPFLNARVSELPFLVHFLEKNDDTEITLQQAFSI
jgi:hypothetical protein